MDFSTGTHSLRPLSSRTGMGERADCQGQVRTQDLKYRIGEGGSHGNPNLIGRLGSGLGREIPLPSLYAPTCSTSGLGTQVHRTKQEGS